MVQRLAAVAVSVWDHAQKPTEGCRVRLEKALTDEKASADQVGAGVGPIAQPATEAQQPAPAAQLEPASSSSGPAVPMPTKPSERAVGFTDGDGSTRTQRAQGSAAKRDVVKPRPASPPTIVPTAEGSGKDEMMTGGLYVIDGIDVATTLVPEEDIAVVNNEDPSATEAIEAHDARAGEKLDSEEVRK